MEGKHFSRYLEQHNDYWNLDDILASEELVSVKALPTVQLNFLRAPNAHGNFGARTTNKSKQDVPIWLARLCVAKNWAALTVPLAYRATTRDILEADSLGCDLRRAVPQYYATGAHLAETTRDEAVAIIRALRASLKGRLKPILDSANLVSTGCSLESVGNNNRSAPNSSATARIVDRLDELELALHRAAQRANYDLLAIQTRDACRLRAAPLVAAYRRKRFESA